MHLDVMQIYAVMDIKVVAKAWMWNVLEMWNVTIPTGEANSLSFASNHFSCFASVVVS